jgi:hypothetical protein
LLFPEPLRGEAAYRLLSVKYKTELQLRGTYLLYCLSIMAANTDKPPSFLSRFITIPPLFTKATMEVLAETPELAPSTSFPACETILSKGMLSGRVLTSQTAEFTRAILSKDGSRIPQAIAHRGYKAAFPENTMAAFVGAVKVGAHALETDLHLTKDGVVVLSHVNETPQSR